MLSRCGFRFRIATALLIVAATAPTVRAQVADFNGYITTENWLALGPFTHDGLGCSGDATRLRANHIAPASVHCQYPALGDAVAYDPAAAATTGYVGPTDADGNPVWRRLDDGSPLDCFNDLDIDAGRSGGPTDGILTLLCTYFETTDEFTLDICANSDDDQQVWLDGRLIINEAACRGAGNCGAGRCDNTTSVTVEEGVHRIVHVVFEDASGFGGSLRLLQDSIPIVDGHPEIALRGIEGESGPACVPLPLRTAAFSVPAGACPPVSSAPVVVTIAQNLPDGGTVTVTERAVGPFGPEVVEADNGGVVTPLSTGETRAVGEFEDHRTVGFNPACPGGNGDTIEGPPGTYTVTNTGADIWADGDTFEFAYNWVEGDFDLRVHVVDRISAPGARWGKHGIMARQDLGPRSRYTFTQDAIGDVFAAPHHNDDSTLMAARPVHGGGNNFELTPFPLNPSGDGIDDYCDGIGPDDGVGCADATCPEQREAAACVVHDDYLRLVRAGNVFSSYSRPDPGADWTFLGSHDWGPGAPEVVAVGLVASSHTFDCTAPVEIIFDEVDFGDASILEEPPSGVQIVWSDLDAALLADGVVYTVDVDDALLSFSGDVDSVSVFGADSIAAPPVATDLGPFPDFGLDHGHAIGAECSGTSITEPSPGTLEIAGAGVDIWAGGDQFMYAYKEVSGDFSARVRIANQDFAPGSRWGKHGIMARQDCSTDSRYTFISDHGEDRQDATWLAARRTHGGVDNFELFGTIPPGTHFDALRLDRVGNVFTGFVFDESGAAGSPGEWVEVGSHDWGANAPESVQIGLAVTSHQACDLTTITFEDWELEEIVNGRETAFVRGDSDGNGAVNLNDGIVTLNFLFLGLPPPACLDAADADDGGALALNDAIIVFNWLFTGGPAPAEPAPETGNFTAEDCGEDPTEDALDCADSADLCE